MSNQITEQARADFQRARFKAFMNRVLAALSGQRTTLLSYDDIKEKLRIGGPIYRGVQTVRVDQIAGSLNRYHEFDRVFLPALQHKRLLTLVLQRAFRRGRQPVQRIVATGLQPPKQLDHLAGPTGVARTKDHVPFQVILRGLPGTFALDPLW